MTMTVTMTFQKFLTCSVLKTFQAFQELRKKNLKLQGHGYLNVISERIWPHCVVRILSV